MRLQPASFVCARGGSMAYEERKSGARRLALPMAVSDLVRAHGITRDQARRLINRIGNNRGKLDQAARTFKPRLSTRSRNKTGQAANSRDVDHSSPARPSH